ncbi:MAG TPA: hypothetical protein HA222_03450 [Candidatus Diapherotrites archaeon]|uniref:Uncharacterized protein n=1 Tax=Candidatus Iainarchaeum sp. TaxID=3101447 RepID=A0A7J4JZI2_9ARCH|nr:hypothetical protein [Candidatus Diapherotrites archaeon]
MISKDRAASLGIWLVGGIMLKIARKKIMKARRKSIARNSKALPPLGSLEKRKVFSRSLSQ